MSEAGLFVAEPYEVAVPAAVLIVVPAVALIVALAAGLIAAASK